MLEKGGRSENARKVNCCEPTTIPAFPPKKVRSDMNPPLPFSIKMPTDVALPSGSADVETAILKLQLVMLVAWPTNFQQVSKINSIKTMRELGKNNHSELTYLASVYQLAHMSGNSGCSVVPGLSCQS